MLVYFMRRLCANLSRGRKVPVRNLLSYVLSTSATVVGADFTAAGAVGPTSASESTSSLSVSTSSPLTKPLRFFQKRASTFGFS